MTAFTVIGIVIGLALAAAIVWLRGRRVDLFSILLVIGIAGLAAAVTVVRVQQYQAEQAAAAAAAEAASEPAGAIPGGPPAMTNGPPVPPLSLPSLPPNQRPPTGGAAPPAAPNPYIGRPG